MESSKLGKLGSKDFYNGLIMAVVSAVITTALQMIQKGGLTGVDWNAVGTVVVIAVLTYLSKNLGTNDKGEPVAFGSKILLKK